MRRRAVVLGLIALACLGGPWLSAAHAGSGIPRPTVRVHVSAEKVRPGAWMTLTVDVLEQGTGVLQARVDAHIVYGHVKQALTLPRTNMHGQSQMRFRVPSAVHAGHAEVVAAVRTLHFSLTAHSSFAVLAVQIHRQTRRTSKRPKIGHRVPAVRPVIKVWPGSSTISAPKRALLTVGLADGRTPIEDAFVLAAADFREGIVGLGPAFTAVNGRARLWLPTKAAAQTERVRVDVTVRLDTGTLHARAWIRVLVVHRRAVRPGRVTATPASTPVPVVPAKPTATATIAAVPVLPGSTATPTTSPVDNPFGGPVIPTPTFTIFSTPQPTNTPPATPTVMAPPFWTDTPTATTQPGITATAAPAATIPPTPTDTPTARPASTSTPTATPTSTSTATPTVTTGPRSTPNLVADGGFESSQTGQITTPWAHAEAGLTPPAVVVSNPAHSGQRALALGGPESSTASGYELVWQRVTVPASVGSAALSFWFYPRADSCALQAGDIQAAFLGTTDANGNWTILQTIMITASNLGAWQQVNTDVSDAVGQTVNVAFEVTQNGGCWSAMNVDDVSLTTSNTPAPTATPGSLPTATPTATSMPYATPAPAAGANQYQQQLLNLINNSRAQQGLAPYTFSATESNGTGSCPGSYGHSVHMAQVGYISHDQFPQDICLPFFAAGENVGVAGGGESQAVQEIHREMMGEGPGGGHYENIMSSTYTTVGLGLYYSNGTLWLTEDFTG